MKNLFKKRSSKTEDKTEEKRNFFKGRKENPESDQVIETKPKGDFLETDEDLGYC
ncbi:MAG: hypothetical protein IPO78_03960 [Saprospiraceae bacterium]|nr:hypothetical protein [Saprospiraceae bacterium]MBK8484963.1 hypothetical protein [Saprospiraceae bacterium]MBK9223227.1 hypothetical protein [Saprospiraceae bacterium]MBK9720757.1 hypothetical protein [Saprospiraceae bacterium]MBK9727745.1 hypothetical protein [Saprospiraceae bacterium]